MSRSLSANTQAILLLTAPLMTGRSQVSSEVLTPGEYKRLARRLRERQRQPADLMTPDVDELLQACQPEVDPARLRRLLGRGMLLSQVVEHWHSRAIWVVSRADPDYPARFKSRLKEDTPPIIYGCGEIGLLDTGGLAVVGSRDVNETLIAYTERVGWLAAEASQTVISGGARGIDQAAMRGALEAGGKVVGVMADSLERAALNRDHRAMLMDGRLALISPYDPSAGFNVGNAMQRNKLIYALADAALVVNSDFQKGGTWAGAIEQLDRFRFVPVYVRWMGVPSQGLEVLHQKGALLWPEPTTPESFAAALNPEQGREPPVAQKALHMESLFAMHDQEQSLVADDIASAHAMVEPPSAHPMNEHTDTVLSASDELFAKVHQLLSRLLRTPRKETEVAAELNVSVTQARQWLQRLVKDGIVEKRAKPVRYVLKQNGFFDNSVPSQVRDDDVNERYGAV